MFNLAPSILSADFANLQRDIEKTTNSGAKYVHIDVMDGHFVPNITIGADVVRAIRKFSNAVLDVHLMIEYPDKYLDDFINAKSDIITIHLESSGDTLEQVKKIKNSGIKACVSIKPKTDVKLLDKILPHLDMVLVMTVEPGFGGQSFMEEMMEKVIYLRENIEKNKYNCDIQVDGGIKLDNIEKVLKAGANVIVAGSAIYQNDIEKNTKDMLEIMNKYN